MAYPPELFREAYALSWGLHTNTNARAEVVAWADDWIMRLDEWPSGLETISLEGRSRASNAWHELARLAEQGPIPDFPQQLVQQALTRVQKGESPDRLMCLLYPLVDEAFELGGLSFPLQVPEGLRLALYRLHYDFSDCEWIPGFAEWSVVEKDAWFRRRFEEELSPLASGGSKQKRGP